MNREQRQQSEPAGGDRTVANAQGALDVVQTAAETVDGELAAIDDRASEQAADAAWVVDEVSALSATIEEIAATATEVSEQSDRAAEQASDGRAAAQDALETMDDVRAVSQEVAAEVDALRDRIDRIADALAGIDRIADQTNMLALNASIEAARADTDAGGFAVVADEIKQLAEESQEQADDIDDALGAVRQATDDTVGELEHATEEIDAGADQVADAMASLDAVADTVQETADGIASVSTATDEQASTSEAVAHRCETVAERAHAIEDDLASIRHARDEQTAMLGEIDDVLSTADADRRAKLADAPTLELGVPGLNDLCGGGFVVGGQAVIRYGEGASVDGLLAQLTATTVAAGRAVSLTATPTLDRSTLSTAFEATDLSLTEALAEDRLFVLDMFGTWSDEYNVFDLGRTTLGAVNETTVARRDAPLLVVGNIEGEMETVGEQAAREARYENDDGVFDARDTVLNVISDTAVPETLAAFYAGAADQTIETWQTDGQQYLELRQSPIGTTGSRRRVSTTPRPPFVRVGGR
ncbi:methyl-accepting chemotaxis protein [Haloarcula marina]|uniref:methyl-accepting chemotaxis protein n=1 Tax=Haloarcula marina TaxID=2961574 RepID=UPI0020B681CA|nr:methyl-accepting chemotaxis protein [Halomicroarcula marina]